MPYSEYSPPHIAHPATIYYDASARLHEVMGAYLTAPPRERSCPGRQLELDQAERDFIRAYNNNEKANGRDEVR